MDKVHKKAGEAFEEAEKLESQGSYVPTFAVHLSALETATLVSEGLSSGSSGGAGSWRAAVLSNLENWRGAADQLAWHLKSAPRRMGVALKSAPRRMGVPTLIESRPRAWVRLEDTMNTKLRLRRRHAAGAQGNLPPLWQTLFRGSA